MTTAEWRYRRAKEESDRLNAKANHEDMVAMLFLVGINLFPAHSSWWHVGAYSVMLFSQMIHGVVTRKRAKVATERTVKALEDFYTATVKRGF